MYKYVPCRRFLASGDSLASMHYQYLVGRATASNIISETCSVLGDKLRPMVLPASLTTEEWLRISHDFARIWHFPNCIGAIDGKHIVIQVNDILT